MVYKWLHEKNGVTDETCQPYQAKTHSCTAEHICKDCQHNGKCHAIENPAKYKVQQYGFVKGEHPMMAEIMQRGPISCRQAVTKAFFAYKGGIFRDTSGDTNPRHATSILGWGKTATGEKYWVARNSWGTYWGEQGYFKIIKGENQLGIEDECSWGVPQSTGVIQNSEERLMGQDDTLVTNEDLGASIDGAESLVQDEETPSTKAPRNTANAKMPITSDPEPVALSPVPVVSSEDNHASSFFDTKVQAADANNANSHTVRSMNADADEAFVKQQNDAGVQL